MHGVQRGAEPAALKAIRLRYTPRWVQFYAQKSGRKPSDAKWRSFEPLMRQRFSGLCGYCEESCKGEIDHFRPKSVFPRRVYLWSNWVYACHTCNHSKREKWITGGYLNPCASAVACAPDVYLTFDLKTGEIIPQRGLSPRKRKRALDTAEHLKLNAYHHLKNRVYHLILITRALSRANGATQDALVALISSRKTPFSSLTRTYLEVKRIPIP